MLRLIILIAVFSLPTAICNNYLITAPDVFRTEVIEYVMLSVFGTDANGDPLEIEITVVFTNGADIELKRETNTVIAGTPKLTRFVVTPSDLPGDEEIPTMTLRAFSTDPALTFDKSVVVLVTTKNQVVFIQTDKPIYTPDQEVKIRVISLNEELKPTDRNVRLETVTPAGAILDRRDDLTTDTGYLHEVLQFSSYPTYGIWKINVYYGVNYEWKSTVEFELRKYVLPTFEVIIEGQKQILPSDNTISATITARYVYNKDVRGRVQVTMSVVKAGEVIAEFPGQAKELNEQGKASFTVLPEDTAGADWFTTFEGGKLRIEAVVTERATGDRENNTITGAKFVQRVYTFKRDRTVSNFKKGTTFDIKVDLFHSDGSPGANVPTMIEAYGVSADQVRTKLTGTADFSLERSSNDLGEVDFRVDVNQNTETIDVTIKTLDDAYPVEANGLFQFILTAIESPSGAYLQIRVPPGEIQVADNYEAEVVKSGNVEVVGINYFVVVRGKIVQVTSDLGSNLGAQKTIRMDITADMAPSARLVVFSFVNNEVVADSIFLDVVDECQAQLSVRPGDSTLKPGDTVSFTINAPPQSNVGLLAVDEAVYFLKDFHRLTKKKMFQRMETLDLGCGPGGGANSREIFEDAGLVAMTNANLDTTNVRQGYGCPTNAQRRRRRAAGDKQPCYDEFKSDPLLCKACEDGFVHQVKKTCEQRINKYAKRKKIALPADGVGSPPDVTKLDPVIAAFYNCCVAKEAERQVLAGRVFDADLDIDESENTVNVRSNFPETWLFEMYQMPDADQLDPDTGGLVVEYSVPDSITNWIVQASSVSGSMGMCVADEKEIEVSKDVFLQVKMPYSIIRGEQVQVQATLFNYGSREVTANVYMYGTENVCSESQVGKRGPQHALTVPKNDAVTTYFNIIPLTTGTHDIEIKAFSNAENDGIKKQIRVVHEGVERYHSKVIVIDPEGSRVSQMEAGDEEEEDQPLDNEFPFKPETFSDVVKKLQRDTLNLAITDFNAIPGTEQCFITFFGDIMTPSVSAVIAGLNPGSLLGKPMGCGEQTMMFMSANVYTMVYLARTNQITAELEDKGYTNVKLSYERMITYQRDDGAFAAWTHRAGSTWLTAFTIKVFYNVLELGKHVDKDKLCEAFRYLEHHYKDADTEGQGYFEQGNPVVHRDMAGGISGDTMMTAFVLVTLIEYDPSKLANEPANCNVDYTDKIKKSVAFLEAKFDGLTTVYHRTVVAYALNVADSQLKNVVWTKIKEEAKYDPAKGLRHWFMESKALTVEATSYALLTAVYRNEIPYANGMVNWLTEHRDFKRGFSTTSDTAIAFESLAIYASEVDVTSVNMRCECKSSTTANYQETVTIDDSTATLSQRITCPTEGLLVIECEGEGVAQAQVEVIYNTPAATDADKCAFLVFSQMIYIEAEVGVPREKDLYRLDTTVKYHKELSGRTDMVIVEVGLFSGFTAVQSTLDILVASVEYPVDRYEISDRKITLYLESLTTELQNLPFNVEKTYDVKNVQSASVTVYDYYFPEKKCTAFYNPNDDQAELRQYCHEDLCECAAGPCPKCEYTGSELPTYNELYHDYACGPTFGIDYVFEVFAQSSVKVNGFITLTASVSTVLKQGEDDNLEMNELRLFVLKSSCTACDNFEIGHKYLIMGKDGLRYEEGGVKKYKYILDSDSYIEKWPTKTSNKARAKSFNKFKNTLKNDGCAA